MTLDGGVAGTTDGAPVRTASAIPEAPARIPAIAVAPAAGPTPSSGIPDPRTVSAVTAPPASSLTGYRWPIPRPRITMPFGDTPWGDWRVADAPVHDGIDMATFCGDKVRAAHAGTVVAAGRHFDDQLGWVGDLSAYNARLDKKKLWGTLPIVVVIDDGNGYRSVYAHFGKIVVKEGQVVKAGTLLGYEGRTGHATGCHLHYGLFSPLEGATFTLDPAVAKHMKLPAAEIARIDPRLVLPPWSNPVATGPKASAPAASPVR